MPEAYPIQLNLRGRKCVVVGAGPVAARKIRGLCRAGADVHVVSPTFCEELSARRDITRHARKYARDALDGAVLVFACTDLAELNRRIADDARKAGAWCNVADDADACDFTVPARMRRGQLEITVSTGGAGPGLAALVRDRIDALLPDPYGTLSTELARARRITKQRVADPEKRNAILTTLCTECSIKLLEKRDVRAWRDWFERVLERRLRGPDAPTDVVTASVQDADVEPSNACKEM